MPPEKARSCFNALLSLDHLFCFILYEFARLVCLQACFFGLLFLVLNSSALCKVPYCPTYTPDERRLKMHSSVSHVKSAKPVGGAISVCLDQ